MNNYINRLIEGNKSKYYIIEELTDGNLGANGLLYKVKDISCDNFYVAKILNNNKLNRFVTEYTLQGNTKSPFIVKTLDIGKIGEGKKSKEFYIMDLYECNYRHLITKYDINYVRDGHKKLKYILDICEALKYIHLEGNYHRDLKPENILFDSKNDKVLLGDFGLVYVDGGNQTADDTPIGNFDYHAPEQKINGARIFGPYTDIYALGLIINETFTGEIPSGTDYVTIGDVYKQFSFLDALVSKMIVQDYSKRLDNIREVIDYIKNGIVNLNEFEDSVNEKIKFELEDEGITVSDECKKQIFDDILIANSFFEGIKRNNINQKKIKNINFNYHCNVTYNTKTRIYNSFTIYRIYHMIYDIFIYESGTDIKSEDIVDYKVSKEEIDKIMNIFKKYDKVNLNFKRYEREGIKLFLSIKNYHAEEIFERIDREIKRYEENLIDAPLLWIYFYLDQYGFVKMYYDYYPESDILDFIDFNHNNFSNQSKMDNLYNEDFQLQKLKIFVDALNSKYLSAKLLDNEHFEMDCKDTEKFLNLIDERFVDDGSVQCGDVIDFRNAFEKKYDRNVFKIDSGQLFNVNTFLKANNII